MRKKSTKFLSAALAVCMMLSVLPVGAFAAELGTAEPENSVSVQADPVDAEYVEINDTNFPDPIFQQYVKENIDTADATTGQKDGKLSKTERDQVTEIKITGKNCTDLTGIAYFSNLVTLYCYNDKLTTLDLSKNTKLQDVRCNSNNLETLNVSECTNLIRLDCYWNSLTTLDVSQNTALQTLKCNNNKQLQTLNLNGAAALQTLDCSNDKQLTTLDVSQNAKLQTLDCYSSGLTTLNLNGAEALQTLNCNSSHLTQLDVSHNPELVKIDCGLNQLMTLDVSQNAKLQELNCRYNYVLQTLNLNGAVALKTLDCADNNLSELDVSQNLNLKSLTFDNNQLTKLDVSNNKNLSYLNCKSNHLTSLDLTQNTKIGENCFYAAFNTYTVTVNDNLTFDLDNMPDGFDLKNVISWNYGTVSEDGKTLTFDGHEAYYWYNTGCASHKYDQYLMSTRLKQVNQHEYKWEHNETKHWKTCELNHCPGLTDEQKAEAPHDYTNAKDADCNTCGYVRPLYTVTTENATAKLEGETEALNAPVAAGTEVTLIAKDAPEGKVFAGWKLYKVENGAETEITDAAELAKLLKNGTETTATLTMPAYNVKAEPYYENIQYTVTAVNCTVNKPEAAMDDIVTAEPTEPEIPGQRFKGWKVTKKVGDEDVDITEELRDASQNGLIAAELTMPAADVTIEAVFAGGEPELPEPDEGDPGVNIDHIVSVANGEVTAIDGKKVPGVGEKASPDIATAKEGQIVTVTADERLDGQLFMGWVVEGIDLKDAKQDGLKLTFTMPNNDVTLAANYEEAGFEPTDPVNTDTDDGSGVIGGVIIGSAIAVGAYEAGTGIYRVINMPGIPMPSNRIELAELIWEHAGKPEPQSTEFYSDISEDDTDWQKAARWAVEQDLMQDDADNNEFHPYFPVSKLRVCLTWNAAKEKGLFDTDKTAE